MKRTNTFSIAKHSALKKLEADAINCAKLWNELTYRRRQSFFNGKLIWGSTDLERKYKSLIGAATAQQIIRKNNEAWRSFFALLKAKKEGKLPEHIKHIRPVGYWKDRRTQKHKLIFLIRNDCYRIKGRTLQIGRRYSFRLNGIPRWHGGKQGRLEIQYSETSNKWYVYQAVTKIQPSQKPIGTKTCYIDLGVVNLATVFVEGMRQPIAYSGKQLLNQWWADCSHIAEEESHLKLCNNMHISRRLSRMYLSRRRKFRHGVNAFVRDMMEQLHKLGVKQINLGNLTGIRCNNSDNSHRTNSMIHNFWSFAYVVQRIKETAEEYGIKVKVVSEYKTSSICPRCASENIEKRRRLFKCRGCGLEAHRDAVGVGNIASVQGGNANRVMAHPLLSRWNCSVWRTRISHA